MKYDELSEAVKDRLRDKYRQYGLYDDWDIAVLNDACAVAAHLGIQVELEGIYYSGFHSQGDGASFIGTYRANRHAVRDVASYAPNDDTLNSLARQITALQVEATLATGSPVEGTINASSRYSHSGVMTLCVDQIIHSEYEHTLLRLMRSFADWIHCRLYDEYEYLMSDESIDESIRAEGDDYDEYGDII